MRINSTKISLKQCYVFGRWLGDGCRTQDVLVIARANTISQKQEIEKIASYLNAVLHHDNKCRTYFRKQQNLLKHFKQLLLCINKKHKLLFSDKQYYAMIAGFVDSDGSIDYNGTIFYNKTKKQSEQRRIRIVLYNSNPNILCFFNNFLKTKNIYTFLGEMYCKNFTYTPTKKCKRLFISSRLGVYFIGNKILHYLLNEEKKRRLKEWINFFDNYYQKQELNITEIFYSIEGEGRDIGIPKIFIRVKGCPHNCPTCDSKYSGGSKNIDRKYALTLKQIINNVKMYHNTNNIEFTGGSPDWFPQKIGYLLTYFKTHLNSRITMQVSGGIPTTHSASLFRFADFNSYDCKDPRYKIPFVIQKKLVRRCDEIKFLIGDDYTYEFAKKTIKKLLKRKFKCEFVITTITQTNAPDIVEKHIKDLRELIERILKDKEFPKKNVRIFPRLHVILWKSRRGV